VRIGIADVDRFRATAELCQLAPDGSPAERSAELVAAALAQLEGA
jgi:hypothetical protein